MKKYIISLGDKTLTTQLNITNLTSLYETIFAKFELLGSYQANLVYIDIMKVYTYTLSKRGSSMTFLIKEEQEVSNTIVEFNTQTFLNDLDDIVDGRKEKIILNGVSKSIIDDILTNEGFKEFDTYNEDDQKMFFYYGCEEWANPDDDSEYINKLNVVLDISNSSLEIYLEDDYTKIQEFINDKDKILENNLRIESIDNQITLLKYEKEDLESDISDITYSLSYYN